MDLERPAKAKDLAPPALCPACSKTIAAAIGRKTVNEYRRAFSESKLLEVLPYELEPGHTYHVLTGGNVDALSFLKHMVRTQALDYCLFSTWCMADDDVEQFREWVATGRIERDYDGWQIWHPSP